MLNLIDYKENNFKGLQSHTIDIDRYRQLYQMVVYLGSNPKYHVRAESYLEGMCNHLNLFEVKKDKATLIAKLVNDFNKSFYYYEKEDQDGKEE